jgi:hypothetical protein
MRLWQLPEKAHEIIIHGNSPIVMLQRTGPDIDGTETNPEQVAP